MEFSALRSRPVEPSSHQGWYSRGKLPTRGAGEAPGHETDMVARLFVSSPRQDDSGIDGETWWAPCQWAARSVLCRAVGGRPGGERQEGLP